ALDLYRQAIAGHDEEDQPDIALYNRVGDLQTRLGRFDAAAEAYEQAVDLYVESELPNNAIAVCKKMVRHLPGRPAVFLRMGQIRARQGFLVDARESFLTYAERMQNVGDIDEAFRALIEFADLAPNDTDIRLAIAAQMQQHDRAEEAMQQLVAGYLTLRAGGREEDARAFEERILELDPAADVEALAARGPSQAETGGRVPEVDGLAEIELGAPPLSAPGAEGGPGGDQPAFTIDTGGREDEEGRGDAPEEGTTLAGFEPTSLQGLPGLDEEAPAEDAEELEPGPTLEVEVDGSLEEEAPPPLPLLGDEPPVEEPGSDQEEDAEIEVAARMEEALEEAAAEARAGEEDEPGLGISPAVVGEEPAESRRVDTLLGAGDLAGALEAARELVAAEPDQVAHRQRMLEVAFRSGERGDLVEAYLGLAGCLERNGEDLQARAAYQQVLSVDPENHVARAALG
ncbi:MAG TPA: tetratricopeptide repeat protein, partial [Longimicrobiales bacterium]|nr:tetratricopeptide repeat protein [Longimicrobiales bacterium]